MKSLYPILTGIGIIAVVVLMARFWAKQSHQKDLAALTTLKQLADSGTSLKDLLSQAAQADYVLNKADVISPSGIKIKPDRDTSWDQTTTLNEATISEISRVQTGETSLRRRAGGYFLNLKIVNGKTESSTQTAPSR